MATASSRLRELLAASLVHGLVATVLCWQALSSRGLRVLGRVDTETWVFLWGHAWTRHALLEEGRLPYRTTWVAFPDGGVLWLKDLLGTVLMLPVQLLAGIPAAATTWTWLLFTLAGLCTTALLRSLGVALLPAVLGGVLYAVHPHALGEVWNANLEALAGFTLPLWLGALVAAARRPGLGTVLAGAAALWVLLVSNQYWAVAMVPVSAVALAMLLVEGRAPRLRAALAAGASVLLGCLAFLPIGLAIRSSMTAERPLNDLPVDEVQPLVAPYVIDAWQLFQARTSPGEQALPFLDLVYPGWIALLLAVLAPLLTRRGWAVLAPLGAAAFLALSLGPALVWRGQVLVGPGQMPWSWLTSLPGLQGMSLPARMAVPAALLVALGAGLALGRIASWRPSGRPLGAILAVLLAGAGAQEMVSAAGLGWTLPTVAVPAPAAAFVLREARVPGAVLDLPMNPGSNIMRVNLWYQAIHRRPVQASLRFSRPALADRSPLVDRLWRLFRPGVDAVALAEAALEDPRVRGQDLAAEGFAYVVLHQGWLEREGRDPTPWVRLLDAKLGPGLASPDGAHRLWPTSAEARAALVEATAAFPAD